MSEIVIDMGELERLLRHVQTRGNTIRDQLTQLRSAFEQIASSDAVSGAIKDAIDLGIENKHIPIIKAFEETYHIIEDEISEMIRRLRSHLSEPVENGIISQSALDQARRTFERNNAERMDREARFNQIYNSIDDLIDVPRANQASYERNHDRLTTQVNRLNTRIDDFNYTPRELEAMIIELTREIASFENIVNRAFTDPVRLSAKASTDFKERMFERQSKREEILASRKLMENMQGAISKYGMRLGFMAHGIVDDIWSRWEAMGTGATVRDFINTLEEPLKSQFMFLKGFTKTCAISGDPVNMSTGNFLYDHVDMTIGGAFPIEFKRFYNSLDSYAGALGKNWCHNYGIDLTETEDGRVAVMYTDGHQEFYTPNESGTYQAQPGIFTTLTKQAAIDETSDEMEKLEHYTVTFLDGKVYHFNAFGLLTKQVDASGNATRLHYEGEQLIKVENASGHLTFTYTPQGTIEQITDHINRTITYTYEAGCLASYTNVLGNIMAHSYDEKARLTKIINQEGQVKFNQTYDNKDRATKQTFADGSTMSYSYDEDQKTTTFTWQNGTQITYQRDDHYRTTGIIYPDGEEVITYNNLNQRTSFTDKLGHITYFEYDDFGNVSKVTNANHVVTHLIYQENSDQLAKLSIAGKQKIALQYNELKQLTKATDALGFETNITYHDQGLPSTITQADGSRIDLAYDERGNVTQVTDASGITTHYEYDQLNRVIATLDGNQARTEYVYDVAGNIIEVRNATGNSQTLTYNKNNKLTQVTDFNGAVIIREYNSLGKLLSVADPLDRVTELTYDAMWNVSEVTGPNGAKTEFIYNAMNRLETIVKPDGSCVGYQYDPVGNQTGVTDEMGHTKKLEYDALGQLIKVIDTNENATRYTYNDQQQLTSVTDGMNNTVNLEYDLQGRLIQETNALGECRTYTYTSLGKIETILDEAGRMTKHEYEPGGRLKSILYPDHTSEQFSYDNNSNVKTHTNKTGQMITYHYDSLNRVVEIESANGIKQYEYDPVGNVTQMRDELGHVTHYEYSLTGKLTKVVDALGNTTEYTYDLLDQLIEVKQLGGIDGTDGIDVDLTTVNQHNEASRMTIYHRNILGQVERMTDALGKTETFKYSQRGELIEKVDKDNFLTKYRYTKLGDVNHIQYADGRSVEMSYNALRQLTEIKDWLGTTSITLDPLGRATKVQDHNDNVVEYSYGKLGERTGITYPDGQEISYSYDENLRLTQVNDGENPVNYHYDHVGRLTEKSFANGIRTAYNFNALGQLSELTHFKQDEILDKYVYGYDVLGNKTSIEKQRDGLESDSGAYTYSYDPLNRLTDVTKDGNPLHSYKYDSFGNRTSMLENNVETSYTYNSLNQLISSTDGKSFSYDKRGNLTQIMKSGIVINSYEFNPMNRLEKAINHETELSSIYKYNGLSRRVGSQVGDLNLNPTKQIVNTLDLTREYHNLLERKEDGKSTSFTYDFGLLSADGNPYMLDDLGSPVRFGEETYGYDEFGQALHEHQSAQPFGFTGYSRDDISNTLFAQARQYDPMTGRFASEDIVKGFQTHPFTLNQYAYCWNSPMNLVDLDGLMPSSYDAAKMADFIYDRDPKNPIAPGDLVNGWELVDIHKNTNNWFTSNLTSNGLVMGVFRYTHSDGTVEYALVNKGTDTWYNWIDNVRQGIGIANSHDTRASVNFARQFVNDRPGIEVTMIGHSKGGAEARLNAFATGMNAFLFNPATSKRSTLRQNGMTMSDVRNYNGTMITYVVEGEILNNLQGRHTEHIGILRWLLPPDESMGAGKRHGMAAVIEALHRLNSFNDAGGACE